MVKNAIPSIEEKLNDKQNRFQREATTPRDDNGDSDYVEPDQKKRERRAVLKEGEQEQVAM